MSIARPETLILREFSRRFSKKEDGRNALVKCVIIIIIIVVVVVVVSGSGSSVGKATELLAGRFGIESRWARDFPPIQTDPGAHPASCKMGTGSIPGGTVRPRHAAVHSPLSSAAVVEE
jgi:hypothetical protein